MASSRARQTVPNHIWRGLIARDRGCTYPNCDAPPGWCDAAHLDVRVADGGTSTVHDQALACRSHHRIIDRLGLIGRLNDGHIIWYHPDGRPYQPRGPDPP